MKSTRRKTWRLRLFGAWALEKEEAWLTRMARQGWQLTDMTFLMYQFRRIKPDNWIYQLDYEEVTGEDLQEYIQLFADAGWEYVTHYASWHYFRANANKIAVKKIHTDNESRIRMLRRVTRLLLIAGLPSYIWLVTTGTRVEEYVDSNTFTLMDGVIIFVLVLVTIIAYSVLRMFLEIRRLKREGKE